MGFASATALRSTSCGRGYTLHYDAGELDVFVGLFASDGMLQLGPVGFGVDTTCWRTALAGPMADADFACHFTTDEITEFTVTTPRAGVCRFAVHHGRTPNIQGAGTYRDEYRRTATAGGSCRATISFFYMGVRETEWPATPPPLVAPGATTEGS